MKVILGEKEAGAGHRLLASTTLESEVMLISGTANQTGRVVDSGATHHMCNDREAFRKNSIGPAQAIVSLGDKSVLQVGQLGSVTIKGLEITALFIAEFGVSTSVSGGAQYSWHDDSFFRLGMHYV